MDSSIELSYRNYICIGDLVVLSQIAVYQTEQVRWKYDLHILFRSLLKDGHAIGILNPLYGSEWNGPRDAWWNKKKMKVVYLLMRMQVKEVEYS